MEYPPCKYCGSSHGMGIENTLTGEIIPIDICYKCLWKDTKFNVIIDPIEFYGDMKELLKKTEAALLNAEAALLNG
jgi:hypothetical protein